MNSATDFVAVCRYPEQHEWQIVERFSNQSGAELVEQRCHKCGAWLFLPADKATTSRTASG